MKPLQSKESIQKFFAFENELSDLSGQAREEAEILMREVITPTTNKN